MTSVRDAGYLPPVIGWWALGWVLFLGFGCSPVVLEDPIEQALLGKGTLRFQGDGLARALDVPYYVPRTASEDSTVVIALHGNNRDAAGTRDNWVSKAEQFGVLVFAPEFSDAGFPRSSGYILGNVFVNGNDPGGASPKDQSQWAFSYIEPLFDEIQSQIDRDLTSYDIVGHSAGAQFAHRFVLFEPEGRYRRVVAANAGWYSAPTPQVDFPYGLGGSPAEDVEPSRVFERQLIVFAGEIDTDPDSFNLRHTPEADLQGMHRRERARWFFDEGARLAAEAGVTYAWTFAEAPGVGHNSRLMIQRSADLLFR